MDKTNEEKPFKEKVAYETDAAVAEEKFGQGNYIGIDFVLEELDVHLAEQMREKDAIEPYAHYASSYAYFSKDDVAVALELIAQMTPLYQGKLRSFKGSANYYIRKARQITEGKMHGCAAYNWYRAEIPVELGRTLDKNLGKVIWRDAYYNLAGAILMFRVIHALGDMQSRKEQLLK